MGAVRLARAYKQKYKIMKMEGGYSGSYDLMEISIKPDLEKAGPVAAPHSVPEDISVAPGVIDDCIIAPFNNIDATAQIIEENKDELAAVMVEPVQGSCGYVPADHDYVKMLREITKKFDLLLIFDEVQTFRLARGGCQEIYDVVPDITTLGKIVGGGYPVGAIGGNDQYLDLFSPMNPAFLSHSGTFNGTPVVMAAGIATLDVLTAAEIERINGLGEDLRQRLRALFKEVGVVAQVTGIGSFVQVHFTDVEVKGWRQAATVRKDIWSLIHPMLLQRGIFPFPRGAFIISVPMSEEQIEKAAAAFKDCLKEIKPYIEKSAPELIAH
jgi:glutamate-1-semialdehyde 2,1-aminomutase